VPGAVFELSYGFSPEEAFRVYPKAAACVDTSITVPVVSRDKTDVWFQLKASLRRPSPPPRRTRPCESKAATCHDIEKFPKK